jgi:hypothetical protein
MEFSKLYRIMEDAQPMGTTQSPGLSNPTNNAGTPSAEPTNTSFGKEEVRKALLNVERINKNARGMYTPLFNHLRKNPEAMQLFGELINTLAGTTTSVGARMAKPLNM